MIPGEIRVGLAPIGLNAGRRTVWLSVANQGDRAIQVGSHFHFYEVNTALTFDRDQARGMRLNVPAGMSIRFEPGDTRDIELVAFAGERIIHGFRGLVEGPLDPRS
ncbi:MAG: urease subunit beta [Candidatus Sericytochromatia bacterium]|nr:urease subunit beta [Candidatus Sericytochromatia bacterium]